MQIAQLYQIFLRYPSIQTDTRKLKVNDIFFALSGPNFNGNLFALQALQQGAAYAVIDEEIDSTNERLIKVSNTLETLQALAKYHRGQFAIPFIAITGSNGKTTTKELVSTVLAQQYITATTQGNLNNHIGVPLTLLSIKRDTQMAVIEMGANHQKEIESYCTYTMPTHGIITNCGKAHLDGFGGEEGVRKGKGELFDYLRANDGTAFIFDDYDYLKDMSAGINKIYSYGSESGNVTGKTIESEPFLKVGLSNDIIINTQLVGEYNLPNVLCAVAIGDFFGVPTQKIKVAIENYTPGNSRSQMIVRNGNHFILDAYNANPTSMQAAIENFAKITAAHKVLMLGGMMELGKDSLKEHNNIIDLIKRYNLSQVVLVGGDFEKITHPFIYMNNSLEAQDWFKNQHFTNTHFLIKGSRSMMMEKVLD